MATYKIGFHKNNLPGRADNLDDARKVAVKVYESVSVFNKKVAGTVIRIYKGQKEYAQVLFGGSASVDSKGNVTMTGYAYHKDYSPRAPQPFNPKTGKLM